MEAFGFADKKSARAASPNTVFAIGSTSKSMTATLAMALVEKGLFDIDTGIDAYLDEIDLEYLAVDGDFPTTREPIDYYRFYPEAAGGFYSSAADLMRFAQFHAGHWKPEQTVISEENLSRMHNARPPDVPGALAALGFGSVEMPTAGVTQLISNGSVRGGNSHMSILMPGGDIVITAMNKTSRSSLADSIALDIADVLRPGLKEDFGRRVERYERTGQQAFPGDPAWTGRWQGVLEGPGYSAEVEVRITDNGAISMKLGDADWLTVNSVRFPHGSIIGRVEGLIGTRSQEVRLLLRGGILYGHTVVRITDGDTHGSYVYRMRLVAFIDTYT